MEYLQNYSDASELKGVDLQLLELPKHLNSTTSVVKENDRDRQYQYQSATESRPAETTLEREERLQGFRQYSTALQAAETP